jgi:hypothetical protein
VIDWEKRARGWIGEDMAERMWVEMEGRNSATASAHVCNNGNADVDRTVSQARRLR